MLQLNENGTVTYLYAAGKDLVKGEMSLGNANAIIKSSKPGEREVEGYPINVNDTWFFPEAPKKKKDIIEPAG